MFTENMDYSTALKMIADAYATKSKEEADRIYKEYKEHSEQILKNELSIKDMVMTSYHYDV